MGAFARFAQNEPEKSLWSLRCERAHSRLWDHLRSLSNAGSLDQVDLDLRGASPVADNYAACWLSVVRILGHPDGQEGKRGAAAGIRAARAFEERKYQIGSACCPPQRLKAISSVSCREQPRQLG